MDLVTALRQDQTVGHVGSPFPCNEIKLVDVPDMNYTSFDKPFPRGEVCIRGPNIFKGYLHAEDKTREAIDDDGWLHTGDVGTFLGDGSLKIIDRKKHIFKLAQGEYVAPEKLENVYAKCQYVAQVFIHGESLQASLVAIVVPDAEGLKPFCIEKGIDASNPANLVSNQAIKDEVLRALKELGKKDKLKVCAKVMVTRS